MHVGSYAVHIDYRFFFGNDLLFEVDPAHVGHYADEHIALVFADYSADILFVAELPLAELRGIEHLFRHLIAELHYVYARGDIGLIERLYEVIFEVERIDYSSVAEGGIEYFNALAERLKISYVFHKYLTPHEIVARAAR